MTSYKKPLIASLKEYKKTELQVNLDLSVLYKNESILPRTYSISKLYNKKASANKNQILNIAKLRYNCGLHHVRVHYSLRLSFY